MAQLPLITCQSLRGCKCFSLSFITQQSQLHTPSVLFQSTIRMNSEMKKKKESKRVENILSGKLIAWHKNTSSSPTVLLQRLLNPTFKQRSIATSLGEVNGGGGFSFINSGCRSNASTYYSSQLLHLSSNSWLYCSELLGVLNLQQNRRQISSSRVQQLNAFLLLLLLFCFLIRA